MCSWDLVCTKEIIEVCVVSYCCSDDELTPYDMSDDQEMSKASPPRYLRDCLESMTPQIPFISTPPLH